MSLLKLAQNITESGWNQGDVVKVIQNLVTVVTELQGDRTAMDSIDTSLKSLVNQNRAALLYGVFGNPGFVIDTNFDVKNGTATYYTNAGTLKTLSANTSFDTGTAKTVTGSKYGAAVLSLGATGTATVTWAAGAGYDTEAAAIAALTDPGATHTILGYVTIQAHASGFTAGTDALTTGSGGNVCTATTYYNSINPNTLRIGAAVSDTPASMTETGSLVLTPS
jgi:hypothetical protein